MKKLFINSCKNNQVPLSILLKLIIAKIIIR